MLNANAGSSIAGLGDPVGRTQEACRRGFLCTYDVVSTYRRNGDVEERRLKRIIVALILTTVLTSVSVFTILMADPVANAGTDQTVDVGETVQFDGRSSENAASFWWNFRDDGWSNESATPTRVYQTEGVYDVGLVVTASNGKQNLDTVRITVMNKPPVVEAGSDTTAYENEQIAFLGYATDSEKDKTSLTYSWDFGDGYFASGIVTNHAYSQAGVYQALLSVTDDQGAIGRDVKKVTILNGIPEVSVAAITTDEGIATRISADVDNISDTDSLRYQWSNGKSGLSTIYSYSDDGIYNASVIVSDGGNSSSTAIGSVIVNNVAPIGGVVCASVKANITLRATGEKWHDLQLQIIQNDLSFRNISLYRLPGNPNAQEISLAGIVFDLSSTYEIRVNYTPEDDPINGQPQGATPASLIFTFEDGSSSVLRHTFNVNDVGSWEWIANPAEAIIGHDIAFKGFIFDQGADDIAVEWDFGDGISEDYLYKSSTAPSYSEITARHAYDYYGSYELGLSISDFDGGIASFRTTIQIDSIGMSITNTVPAVEIIGNDSLVAFEDQLITLMADAVDDGTIASYSWILSDGGSYLNETSSRESSVTHAFAFSGDYPIIVLCKDDKGAIGVTYAILQVKNSPPRAVIFNKACCNQDEVISFRASRDDSPTDSQYLEFSWDFGDGNSGYGEMISHVYKKSGNYNLTLIVRDNDGSESASITTISVKAIAPIVTKLQDRVVYGNYPSLSLVASADDTPSDAMDLTYEWEFGDGQSGYGQNVEHIYPSSGTYLIELTVIDSSGLIATTLANVMVSIDQDGDSLSIDDEGNLYLTNDTLADTDSDYITDYWEIFEYSTDPTRSDSDDDGVNDWYEIAFFGAYVDTDGDGLNNPWDPDSDGDGIIDGLDQNPLLFNSPDGNAYQYSITIDNIEGTGFDVSVGITYASQPTGNPIPIIDLSPIQLQTGGVGPAIDISSDSPESFTSCVAIRYSAGSVIGIQEDCLSLYNVHGYLGWHILTQSVVDSEDDIVWAVVSEFSPFQVGYAPLIDSDHDGIDDSTDINPLLDVLIQINIQDIRALDLQHYLELDSFYPLSMPVIPDFYCIISVDGQPAIISDVFEWDSSPVDPNWNTVWNVPDDQPLVDISISLWDKNLPSDAIPFPFFDYDSFAGQQPPYTIPSVICDISRDPLGGIGTIWSYPPYQPSYSDIELTYDLIAQRLVINDETDDDGYEYDPDDGNWYPDANGVGYVSGAEDGCPSSGYQYENDCEMLFDVTQNDENDFDMDGFENSVDLNPFCDVKLTIDIKEIIALQPDPDHLDFFCSLEFADMPIIESETFGVGQSHVYPEWTVTFNIPDDQRYFPIRIALFEDRQGFFGDIDWYSCDISRDPDYYDIELTYDAAIGQLVQYSGDEDDWFWDANGVGHVSGEEDGNVPAGGQFPWNYEYDCEMWFEVKVSDNDNDNAPYWYEVNILGTDPFNPDCDNDGLLDGDELKYAPFDTDSDNDGITNIWDPDSDNDGLLDGYEDKTYYEWDWCKYVYLFDHIYMWNLHEYINVDLDIYAQSLQEWHDNPRLVPHYTSPIDPDSDNDGLSDGQEVNTYYAHQEVNWPHYTCPLDPDTDADGATDGEEIEKGTCPVLWDQPYAWVGLAPVSSPDDYSLTLWEEDISVSFHWSYLFIQSGCSDPTFYLELDGTRFFTAYSSFCYYGSKIAWDIAEGYHTIDIHYSIDWDSSNSIYIYASKTYTFLYLTAAGDADGDGMPNGWEYDYGLDPFNAADRNTDPDGDGLVNYLEYLYRTYPCNQHSDADTLNDGDEVNVYHTDPILADTDGDTWNDDIDTDPLINIKISISINEIIQWDGLGGWWDNVADFYCEIIVESGSFTDSKISLKPLNNRDPNSHVWGIPLYEEEFDVPDDQNIAKISIILWDDDSKEWLEGSDDICDISKDSQRRNAEIYYDMRIANEIKLDPISRAESDDFPGDGNGVGHVSGSEDGSIITDEDDCEIWFDITQSDRDGDSLSYWEEVDEDKFNTDPTRMNTDNDGLSNSFEKKNDPDGMPWNNFGLNPISDDTDVDGVLDQDEDLDEDGLTNGEECSEFGTDPNLYEINLDIGADWEMSEDYIDDLIEGLKLASDFLYDVTDGYLYFRVIRITDKVVNWVPNDFDIRMQEGTAHQTWNLDPHWPQWDGSVIWFPQYWDRHTDGTEGYHPNELMYYAGIIHEWMHSKVGLPDEYIDSLCPICIMYHDWEVRELCAPDNHNADISDTSCWELLFATFCDKIWFDLNQDGERDSTDPSDANTLLTAYDDNGPYAGPDMSYSGSGAYTFITLNGAFEAMHGMTI